MPLFLGRNVNSRPKICYKISDIDTDPRAYLKHGSHSHCCADRSLPRLTIEHRISLNSYDLEKKKEEEESYPLKLNAAKIMIYSH